MKPACKDSRFTGSDMTPSASLAAAALATISLVAPGAALGRPAAAKSAPPDHHVLAIRFDPASGSLKGTDRLVTPWQKALRFQLHDGLSFSATCSGRRLVETTPKGSRPRSASVRPDEGEAASNWHELRISPDCADERGLLTIDFEIQGRIHDPVEQEPSLHFVTGDRTSGIISADGIFLAGGTFWYPQVGNLETYDFTADLPAGWSLASQGARVEPTSPAPEGLARQRYVSSVAADGLALSAGPYVVAKRQHGSVEIATFLLAEDAAMSDMFLDAAATEIDRLEAMLGPYPYEKFDIVENFFTTGYGFPAYTLLGRDVIKMGPRALRPGYLDHEIAHVWFGNFVHVDVSKGNWCEGLVTYLTNYLGSARGGDDEALAARRRVSQRYSVDVPAEKDFPPAAFVTKSDDVGASVGYGKVSMIFHVLRRQLGDDAFWKGLRAFVEARGGRRGSWDDIEAAFEAASGRDLTAFFAQWIGRAGLPALSLENVAQDAGGTLRAEIVQSGEIRALDVDLEILGTDGTRRIVPVALRSARTAVSEASGARIARVTLDPAFHVPHGIATNDLPASLSRTLAGDGKPPLVVHPDPPGSHRDEKEPQIERSRALKQLADMLAPSGAALMASKDVADRDARGSSLLVLGNKAENTMTARYAPAVKQALGIDIEDIGSFRAGDRRWRDDGQSILVSIPHPDRPGATITFFVPNGIEAASGGRTLFYYGWDTWVAMDGGLAKQRGTEWPHDTAMSVRLADLDGPTTAGARMLATTGRLADPRLEGRDAGSAGAAEAATIVATSMVAAGLEPFGTREYMDSFAFDLIDVPQQPVLKVSGGDGASRFLKVMPAHGWIPLPPEFETTRGATEFAVGSMKAPVRVPFPRGLVFAGTAPTPSFSGLDLEGSLAVVLDPADAPQKDGGEALVRRIASWIDQARLRNAVGLLVLRPAAEWPAPAALAAHASMVAPSVAKRREKTIAEGGHRAAERAAAGDRARATELPLHSTLPLIFGGAELTDALEADGGLVPGRRTWDGRDVDVRFNLAAERIVDRNVLGIAMGRDATKPIVVVQAHYDGVGRLADGRAAQAAVDNASGVAVLVEVARRLVASPATASVAFIATGAEEWGLQGSRKLVGSWDPDRPQVRAVINVDSVGQAGRPLHVVGRSQWPSLAQTVESAARASGVEIGSDIDMYAHRWGSDHWPWSAKGVPAVDLFQADYAILNTGADEIGLLDAAALEKIADVVEASVRDLAK